MHQIKPLLYRKLLIYKRTKLIIVKILLPLLISIVVPIVLDLALNSNENLNPDPATFKEFDVNENPIYAIVANETVLKSTFVQKLSQSLSDLIQADTSKIPKQMTFSSSTEFSDWVYAAQVAANGTNVLIGIEVSDTFHENENGGYYPLTVLYNNSVTNSNPSLIVYFSQLQRALWRTFGIGELTTRFITLNQQSIDLMMNSFIPFFMIFGLTGFFTVVSSLTTDDVKSAKRQYLITCGVRLPIYWISTIIIDYIIWIICCFITWIIFYALKITLIIENPGFTLWGIFFDGFSYIILHYCLSFIFTNPETSGSICSMISLLLVVIGFVVDIVRGNNGNEIVNWVYALFPPLNFFSIFSTAGKLTINGVSKGFGELWSDSQSMALLIFSIFDIFFWSFILFLIEFLRVKIPQIITKKQFSLNQTSISYQRRRQTEEAIQAQREIENLDSNSISSYSVRVLHVSRLFLNKEKVIIPAVNDVTFGIKKGDIFGFLGSNGAGKPL